MAEDARHFRLVRIKGDGDQILLAHGIAYLRARLGKHEITQGKYPHQFVHAVHHIDIVRNFLVFKFGANLENGVIHRGVGIDQNDFRIHDSGGSVRVKGQQGAQLKGIFRRHAVKQHVAVALIHLVQHVYRVIGPHFRKNTGCVVGVHIFQHVTGNLSVQLRQGLGGLVGRQMTQHTHLFGKAELFKLFRSIGGMRSVRIQFVAAGRRRFFFRGLLGHVSASVYGRGESVGG